ncbi:MAG: hypothetical protein RL637_302 [Pseudomonadota bacterium]
MLSIAQEKILQITRGFQLSQCLFTAVELEIPDYLTIEIPKSCDQLAEELEVNSQALYRLLNALEIIGLVKKNNSNQFCITEMAYCLQKNHPDSIRNFVLLRAEQDYLCWKELTYSIKTGKNAFEKTFWFNRYQYNRQNPQLAARFDQAMSELAKRQQQALLNSYDFSQAKMIADIGGGQATLLSALLDKYSQLNGILLEQPETIKRAKLLFENHSFISRLQLISGSFFESFSIQADIFILKHILHNLDDEHCLQILRHCRQTMQIGNKILIVEMIASNKKSEKSVLLDLTMLVGLATGKKRVEAEFKQLLAKSGFQLIKTIDTGIDIGIIEAQAV